MFTSIISILDRGESHNIVLPAKANMRQSCVRFQLGPGLLHLGQSREVQAAHLQRVKSVFERYNGTSGVSPICHSARFRSHGCNAITTSALSGRPTLRYMIRKLSTSGFFLLRPHRRL
jgi:hypothetical protein